MSQSGRPGHHATMELARQKLDDLDSLIQRMLDLPVVDSDDGVEQHVPPMQVEDRIAPPAHTILVAAEPETKVPETWNDFRRMAGAPAFEEKKDTLPAEPPSSAAEPVRSMWWLGPLVAVNRIFDLVTHLLGPLGKWLRSDRGRRLLGWVGVVSLIAALLAALLDGMGWLPR